MSYLKYVDVAIANEEDPEILEITVDVNVSPVS